MIRITSARTLATCGLVSLVLALTAGGTSKASAARKTLIVDFQLGSHNLHCDGDSTWLRFRAVYEDGTPAAFLPAEVRVGYGVVKLQGQAPVAGVAYGMTDAQGRVRARITPHPNGTSLSEASRYSYGVHVDGSGAPSPHFEPCPFLPDAAYTITASAFNDSNGNGVQNRAERTLRGLDLWLYGQGNTAGAFIPGHLGRTNRSGSTTWTGLFDWGTFFNWGVCTVYHPGVDVARYEITSVNGQANTEGECATVPRPSAASSLAPGNTRITLGVRRIDPEPED